MLGGNARLNGRNRKTVLQLRGDENGLTVWVTLVVTKSRRIVASLEAGFDDRQRSCLPEWDL